jgi:hypothetical protein
MSKYKLIKKYPCLPDTWYVGIIVTKKYDSVYSTDVSGVVCVNLCKEQVENYPEFWEKIVEKDYEILSYYAKNISGKGNNYIDPDYIWWETSKGNGKWSRKGYITSPYNTDEINNHKNYGIYSVKRLSDGLVFNVGDKTFDGVITKFEILDGVLIVFISDVTWIKLDLLQKVKQPLFKTEDGLDIYEGDDFWFVKHSVSPSIDSMWCAKKVKNYDPFCSYFKYEPQYEKYFSTKEAAEEYVLMNKPCLSLKDVFDEGSIFCLAEWEKRLKDLVKSKLK